MSLKKAWEETKELVQRDAVTVAYVCNVLSMDADMARCLMNDWMELKENESERLEEETSSNVLFREREYYQIQLVDENGDTQRFLNEVGFSTIEPASKRFPVEDWKYEVSNGDTNLGYEEWLKHKIDAL